jgi:hypothetical protein
MIQPNEPNNKSTANREADEQYMRIAIEQAKIAEENGDVR